MKTNFYLLFTADIASGNGAILVPGRIGLAAIGLKIDTAGRIFVVQNRLNQVAVVDLSSDFSSGTVRTRLSDPDFVVPSTIAAAGGSLFAVNARFGIAATPETPFVVVRFNRP